MPRSIFSAIDRRINLPVMYTHPVTVNKKKGTEENLYNNESG
jgi:hypothetical protein